MQRRQRGELFEFGEHFGADANRSQETAATVDDAMSDRVGAGGELIQQAAGSRDMVRRAAVQADPVR